MRGELPLGKEEELQPLMFGVDSSGISKTRDYIRKGK